MSDLAWLALIALGASYIGDSIVLCLGSPKRKASALTLGLACFSYLCLVLGRLGLWAPWLLQSIVIALAALGAVRAWSRLRSRRKGSPPGPEQSARRLPRRPDCLESVLALLLVVSVLLSTLAALDPPDAQALSHYHLRAPTWWIENGRVAWPFKDLVYHYPQGAELLYALGLSVGSARLPQLIHLLTAIAALWGIVGLAQRRWGRKTALLAGLLYWSIPEVHYLATIPLVDLAWSSAEILAVIAFLDGLDAARHRERLGHWARAGALVGWASAVKYAALWTVLLLGIGVIWASLSRRQRSVRDVLRTGLAYAAPAIAVAGFWYAKNGLRFGNPLYPFLWGGRGLSPQAARAWTGLLRRFGPSRTLWRFLRLPWDLLMTRRIPAMRPALFPYPIALIPALALYRRWERASTILLAFSLAYLGLWYWTGTQQMRFALTPVALLSLLAARGGGEVLTDRRPLARVAGAMTVVALLLGLGLQWTALASHILPGPALTLLDPAQWPRW